MVFPETRLTPPRQGSRQAEFGRRSRRGSHFCIQALDGEGLPIVADGIRPNDGVRQREGVGERPCAIGDPVRNFYPTDAIRAWRPSLSVSRYSSTVAHVRLGSRVDFDVDENEPGFPSRVWSFATTSVSAGFHRGVR